MKGRLGAIARNSGWLLFDNLIRLLLGILVGAWVARYLGPTQYGELAFVLACMAVFQSIANLGTDGIIVRDIARDGRIAPQLLGTAFAWRLAAGSICWMVAVCGIAMTRGIDHPSVALTALVGGMLVFQAADTVDLWFQSQSQSRRTVIAKLLAHLIANGAKVVLVMTQATLPAFAALVTIEGLLAAVALALAYRRFPTQGVWRADWHRGKQLMREAWPFLLSGLSVMFYMRIDQVLIGQMLGEKALGQYAAAQPLSSVWHVIPVILATSFAPYVAIKKAEGEQAYFDSLATVFRLLTALALLYSIPVALLAPILVNFLYGVAYAETASVLAIHVFTNIFIGLGVAQNLWLLNERKAHLSLYATLIGASICIVGNILLIPKFGIVGAAVVAVAAQAGSAVGSNLLFAPRIFRMQIMALLLRKHST